MIRRLYITACGLSLLLCIAATVLWAMSLRHLEFQIGPNRWNSATITIDHGMLEFVGPHEVYSPWYFTYGLWRPIAAAVLLWASGYDLRATPDRCPECGRVPGQDASAEV